MGGKTNTTKSSVALPSFLEDAYKGILGAGAHVASQPYKGYTGSRTAGFTPMQEQGFQGINSAQGMGLPFINQASDWYGDVRGMNWGNVPRDTVNNSSVNNAARGVTGQTNWGSVPGSTVDYGGLGAAGAAVMPGVDRYDANTLSAYMNPFMSGVLDPVMQRMQQEDAKQVSNLKGSGISMGVSPALGDRMGLAASDLAGQQALSRNQVIGDLTSQGFQNAQSQLAAQQQLQLQGGTQDQARMVQVQQLMQQGRGEDAMRLLSSLTTQNQSQQTDAARLMQAQQLMQQGRQADADRILQSMGQKQQGMLGSAAGMAGLGTQAQDLTYQGIDYLLNAGRMQQGLGQQGLDTAYNDWMTQQNYPRSQVDWLASLAYGSPGRAATTTSTQTPGPSLLSQLGGLGLTAAGMFLADGGRVPRIDVRRFGPAPQAGLGLGRVPDGPGVHRGGENHWYVNALPRMTSGMAGHRRADIKPLDDELLGFFDQVGTAQGSDDKGDEYGSDMWALKSGGPNAILWRNIMQGISGGFSDNAVKGGRDDLKRRAAGGPLFGPAPPPPGSPEYQAELDALLKGEGSVPPGSAPPAPAAGLDAATAQPAYANSPPPGSRTRNWFENKNLPLIYAGLNIMAGESPHALTNVGAGAAAGLKQAQDYAAGEAQLDANPIIDDSGPTIRVWYPSESRWEDTGIPSYKWAGATADTTGTEKERYMAGKYGADWRQNPEAIQEFETLLKTPQTVVDLGGNKKFSEGLAEQGLAIVEQANAAVARASDLEFIAAAAANPDVYTGAGGEAVDRIKSIASTFFGLPVKGVPEGELIRQMQARAVGTLKGNLPGPMSNADRDFLMMQTPGLTSSTEGIMLATEIANIQAASMAAKKTKLLELMEEAEQGGRSTTSALIEFQRWLNLPENRVFTPETYAAATARAKERAAAAGGQHAPTAGSGDLFKKYNLDPGMAQ